MKKGNYRKIPCDNAWERRWKEKKGFDARRQKTSFSSSFHHFSPLLCRNWRFFDLRFCCPILRGFFLFFIVFCFICQHLANTRLGKRRRRRRAVGSVWSTHRSFAEKQGKNRKKSWIIWNSLMMECPFFLSSVFSLLFFHKKPPDCKKKVQAHGQPTVVTYTQQLPAHNKEEKKKK